MIPRLIFTVLALAAMSWGAFALVISRQAGPLERVAKRIIIGEPFNAEALALLQPAMAAIEANELCHPAALRAVAIIRLRRLETAAAAAVDEEPALFRQSARHSLSCTPADPYLWLVMYGTESSQSGLGERPLQYLRMSYQTGPNEGWVALKRNRLALAAFAHLPRDVAEMAIGEFVSLLATRRAFRESVDTMQGLGRPVRDLIVPRLATLPIDIRQDFSNWLYRAGLEVEIPGIARREPRPWR
jgi:hypothetical protein